MVNNSKPLANLWRKVQTLNDKYYPNNPLMPIVGHGKTYKPKIMFVFINPTVKNITSSPNWTGFRAPFIGTKQVWRVFHKAGLLQSSLINQINQKKPDDWNLDFAKEVYQDLTKQSFYFTNIVKWTGSNADLPNAEKTKLFLPLLKEEIDIVKPDYILTFGLIPFTYLTNEKLKMKDYYEKAMKNKKLHYYETEYGKVIPCYFPVGRGNPKRAVEILKMIKTL